MVLFINELLIIGIQFAKMNTIHIINQNSINKPPNNQIRIALDIPIFIEFE